MLEKLDGLPLALVQAGSYLRETNMTTSTYLEFYEKTWTELMEDQEEYSRQEYANRSVLTTWRISYEQVSKSRPTATRLLELWAFLYYGDIWYRLVACLEQIEGQHELPKWASELAVSELSFRACVRILSQYSLITPAADTDGFSIHPVVHSWSLHNVDSESRKTLREYALCVVARLASASKDDLSRDTARRLVPQAKAAGQQALLYASDSFADEIHTTGDFLSD